MRRMYSKAQIEKIAEEHGSKVKSVNGKDGAVVLDATDIRLTTNLQTVQDNFIRVDESLDGKLDASKSAISNAGGLVVPTSPPLSVVLTAVSPDREQVQVILGDGLELTGSTSPFTLRAAERTLFRHNVHLSNATETFNAYFTITKKNDAAVSFTELTVDTLVGTSGTNMFSATGVGNTGPIIGIYLTDYMGQTAIKIVGLNSESYLTISDARVTDVITEI